MGSSNFPAVSYSPASTGKPVVALLIEMGLDELRAHVRAVTFSDHEAAEEGTPPGN